MKEQVKKTIVNSYKQFSELSEEEKMVDFGKMLTADFCLTDIINFIKKMKPEEITNSYPDIARKTLQMATVFLKAGVDIGYCDKVEEK